MDAFYASVEQRDNPELRGRPVVVGGNPNSRGVVCSASYEARKFGVRSAIPCSRAQRLCPEAIFVPPHFDRYREVSRQIRAIFLRHTPLVEPLSLDEAYLDVTNELTGLPTATAAAEMIRSEIFAETSLTASAGVAPNKFLAKIASDWRKPNGLFVIKPHQVERFLAPLPVGRLPGVGHATEESLHKRGIKTVGDLRELDAASLTEWMGKFGQRLYELARGIDERPVEPSRPMKSISSETTFETDLAKDDLKATMVNLCDDVWQSLAKKNLRAKTITVKLRDSRFQTETRRVTNGTPLVDLSELVTIATTLLERFSFPATARFRLLGVGASNFTTPDAVVPTEEAEQPELFTA